MERLIFDSNGKIAGLDGQIVKPNTKFKQQSNYKKTSLSEYDGSENEDQDEFAEVLKKSQDLEFLKEEPIGFQNIYEHAFWSLHSEKEFLKPLKFSNEKTQEDVVKEIVNLIKNNNKIIFLHGTCGTGKSAIALNIGRILGKTSVVVPVKNLQKQYEEDYMGKKYLIKKNGEKMKIAMITGRQNHDSIINPGQSCADPSLPENIKISEKNLEQIEEYYKANPNINNKDMPDLKDLRRISIAPSNPYWSPILPSDFELNVLKDAQKKKYLGCDGREYTFYHRKEGCSYYDQYLAYMKADVIIYNAAKYLTELSMGRKPMTDVEIIDEADDFLDSLFQQQEINLTRLHNSIKVLAPDSQKAVEIKNKLIELIDLEEKNKRILGVDEKKVFHVSETKVKEILELFLKSSEFQSEVTIDELSYANKALEAAESFEDSLSEVYLTFRKFEDNLLVKLVSTNLSAKIEDLLSKSKSIVFMSGTLHSETVLKNIFGITNFKVVEAETINFGNVEIIRTGKEKDCKYSNFSAGKHTREEYLKALDFCIQKAKKPTLIHVNAFQDLPNDLEKQSFMLNNLMSADFLYNLQIQDKTGRNISLFKQKLSDCLFTTKCSRGVDFPGDMCNSIIFTKYPNPNISDTFWKILQQTHPNYFWEFYKDKARREFIQRIYRAVRSKDDQVYILSPDSRVLDSVKEFQVNGNSLYQ
ncbi:DEAD/DEAH box helicase family protein [Candidatus Pacearchaeota archaeon]|nr:DEAD/DEAH box helicase family protein [Candidatus Pacearchaeota archaeon]